MADELNKPRLTLQSDQTNNRNTKNAELRLQSKITANGYVDYIKKFFINNNKKVFVANKGYIDPNSATDEELLAGYQFEKSKEQETAKQGQFEQGTKRIPKEQTKRHAEAEKQLENEQKAKFAGQFNDFLDNGPIRYIPFVYSFNKLANANNIRKWGNEDLYRQWSDEGGLSALIDTGTTLLFGPMSRNSIIGTMIGGQAGKYIGEKYDHPILGEITGSMIGGGVPDLARNLIQNTRQALRTYNVARTFNNSVNNTEITHIPVWHSTPYKIEGPVRIKGEINDGFNVSLNRKDNDVIKKGLSHVNEGPIYTYEGTIRQTSNNTSYYTGEDLGYYNYISTPGAYNNDIVYYNNTFDPIPSRQSAMVTNPNTIVLNDNILFMNKNPFEESIIIDGKNSSGKYVQEAKGDGFDELRQLTNNFVDNSDTKKSFIIPGKGHYIIENQKDGLLKVIIKNVRNSTISERNGISKEQLLEEIKSETDNILSEFNTYRKFSYLENDNKKVPWSPSYLDDDNSYLNQQLINKIKQSIQDDIDLVYKSSEYKIKFLKAGFTEDQYKQFLKEVQQVKDEAIATYYKNSMGNLGKSNNHNLTYGFNINNIINEIEDAIESTLFHEFGHTQNRASELKDMIFNPERGDFDIVHKYPMLAEIRNYNESILNKYNIKNNMDISSDINTSLIPYVTKNEELLQRLREGQRKQILEGISDENINKVYDFPEIKLGALPKVYKKEPLNIMTKSILSMTPLIIGANYVYNNR